MQKIVPDGYPEIILHYGDSYRINLHGDWQMQGKYLLAGQLTKHFFLENTGKSGMIGIKFQPGIISTLFGVDMSELTDKVIPLPKALYDLVSPVIHLPIPDDKEEVFSLLDSIFIKYLEQNSYTLNVVDEVAKRITDSFGLISIEDSLEGLDYSQRQLERLFKKGIGLTPKFYSRIIRFAHIFQLMQNGTENSWSDIVYGAGFYDQSHFIKNFKEFTGEDPSTYGFEEKNMANFHLKR